MQITDLYQTKIEIVKSGTSTPYYNVNIDATDVQVIVTLTDFNGAAVSGKNVTLTVDHGAFTKVGSGSSTPTGSASGTSCSATTDSNGKISALYTASEWGLATFSANTHNTQINVKGWKIICNYTGFAQKVIVAQLQYNGEKCKLILNFQGLSFTKSTPKTLFTMPYKYRSSQNVYSLVHPNEINSMIIIGVDNNNQFNCSFFTTNNTGTINGYLSIEWTL